MYRKRFLCLTMHGGKVHTSIYYDELPRVKEEDRPFIQLYEVAGFVEDGEIFRIWDLCQTIGDLDRNIFMPLAHKLTTTKPLGD